MYSRHGMALVSTVRHFAPPTQAADADGFLNLPPWEGVPGGWDVPDYALGAADSGDLPLITDLPDTASGDVPLAGLPSTPPPIIGGGGIITPGPNTLPTDYVFEDADGELVTGTYTLDNSQYWALEIRTSGGALVQEVTEHWAGSAVFNVDQAPELEFCTTLDAFDNFATVGNREIWLRDWRRHLMGRFEIVRVERCYAGAARYFRIQAQGIVARLSQAPVITYSTPVDSVENEDGSVTRTRRYSTVGAIVAELLAFQTRTPLFTVGTIDPAIRDTARMFAVDDTNVMDALRQLQNSQPAGRSGFLWIDDQNKLQWRLRIGVDRAVLSSSLPTPSLRGATVRMCLDEMATRVYLFGALKTTDTFTSLTDAGQPNDYIQANTGTYGVRTARRTDSRIKYPETLLAAAQRILAETSVPYYEVEVDTVDLVKADGDYGAVDLWPGSEYRVDDDTASPLSDVYLVAQSVTYDLSNPLATGIKLANRARRLSDIFDRILGQLNPTVDEETLLESWEGEEDGDPYPRHFARMVARAMEEATDPDTPVGESLADAFRELLEDYIPPFDSDLGPNENNIADALQDHETRIQDLEDGAGIDYGAQTDIKPVVAGDAVAGTLDKVARADHQHQGMPILTFLTGDPLPGVSDTAVMLVEVDGEGKALRYYTAGKTRLVSARKWLLISEFEEEEE